MATYNNFSDVADNAEFKDFIRDKFGIKDVSQISDIEQTALLMSFKSHANDLSNADIEFLEDIRQTNSQVDMEALIDVELGTAKDFGQLSTEEQIYISVKNYDAKDNGVSLDEIANKLKERKPENTEVSENGDTEYNRDLLYKDFLEIASTTYTGENAVREQREDMDAFVAKKDAFLKSHPELEEEVNNQLEAFVKTQGNEIEWNENPHRITEDFKKYYNERFHKADEVVEEQNTDNTNQPKVEEKETNEAKLEQKDKEALLKAFDALVLESEGHISKQETEEVKPLIRDFLKQKDEYLKAHPEDKNEVDKYIDTALSHQEADNQFTISEYFRIAYGQEDSQFTAWLTNQDENTGEEKPTVENTGNSGNDGNTGGTVPPLTVGGIEGPENTNEKEPLNVTPGGNGNEGKPEMEVVGQERNRSAYSDANEQWLDYLKLATMKEMGVFTEAVPEIDDVEGVIDMMHKYEPQLSEDQVAELNDKVTTKILKDEELFESTPPSVLAEMYEGLKQKAQQATDEQARNDAVIQFAKVANRIDNLTEMVATEKDLYFADITNIADTKRGYEKMFAVRAPDLTDDAANGETDEIKAKAGNTLQHMQTARGIIDSKIAAYDEAWNLNGISAENAEQVDKRFEKIRKNMEGVEIDDETAKLVSNFKFMNHDASTLDKEQLTALQMQFPDRDFSKAAAYADLKQDELKSLYSQDLMPKPEPQFVDANGNQSHEWTEGAKVIPGSKLDKAITATKQAVLLQNLGTDVEITPQFLQQEVSKELPKTLYALHVVDMANRGIAEKPDQFTNKAYFEEFKNHLGDTNRRMAIGATSFNAGLDTIVNQTGGYADRLTERLKLDKDGKEVKNPNLKVTTKLFEPIQSIDKRAKDRVVGGNTQGKQHYWRNLAKTAVSAFGISAAMRVVGTAAQSVTGLAWMAGGLSAAVGVATTTMQIISWNKQRKAAGLETGFKAMCKDRRMVMAMGTTALGVAAVTCMAIPGLQPAGMVIGAASMALGATNSAMTAYKAAREAGDSKLKSLLKAGGMVLAAGLGAFGGRAAADAGINAYNAHNPDNNIFKHQEERITDPGTQDETHRVVDRDALEADAKRYNEQYNISDRVHHGMSHDDYMKAVEQYNSTHPDNQITNPDEMLKHAYNSQHGRVYGPGYVIEHGLDPDVVNKVGHLINSDGTINDDAVKAFQGSDLWKESGLQNFVQRVHEDVELRPDLYPTRTPESTYSDTMMPMKDEIIPGKDPTIGLVPIDNARPEGVAMFGLIGNIVTAGKKLKERVGALKDGIKSIFKPKPKQEKTPVVTPPVQETKPKKPYVPPKVTIKIPEERKYLDEEYWMIHGYNPAERKIKGDDGKVKTVEVNPMLDPGYKAYVAQADQERIAAGGKPWMEFLQERRAKMDGIIEAQTSSYLGGHNAQLNVDILDPVGYKQVLQKQAELKAAGKSMNDDEIKKAIKLPTPEELKDDFKAHRPTSKLCKIIRDAFWRKDNGVDVKNPEQRSTVEMNGKMVDGNKKVFSFNDFVKSAEDTMVRTTKETERDATKAPVRRTFDETGKAHKQTQR